MKKAFLSFLAVLLTVTLFAQANPVSWTYTTVKKGVDQYQVIAKATIGSGWHIYSQKTPDGGPVPTKFTFAKNPLVTIVGTPEEKGVVKKVHDKNFGIDVLYFSNTVSFVQTVKVKGKVKTNINGEVEFMVCNDHECLPPSTKSFSVKLQ